MSRAHAVVLGWAGSTERQLRGIASVHRALGLAPTWTAPRVFRAMALPWGWRTEGRALARRLLALDDRPIVVHAFSNAGFWTYAAAMRALANDVKGGAHVRDRIVALVLDSAPGFPPRLSPDFATRSSAMAMMPLLLRALGRPPALSHPALDAPLRAFMRFWYHLSPVQIREIEESLAIVRDTGRWPVLALCSSADTLVPIEHVEAFVASMRERRDVRVVRWRDSEHVRHLLVHRHEYLEAMRALIDDVLARTV